MLTARIYRPSRTAMQSGKRHTLYWALEISGQTPDTRDPYTNWVSSGNTLKQVRMKFDTLDDAVSYAKSQGLCYKVIPPHGRKPEIRRYGDQFRYRPAPL